MKFAFRTLALSFLFAGALAQAATVTGTVTDKTTGKPAAGDTVVLVEPMSGMSEVGHATTDAQGHYTLNLPGSNPYLIRVTHQGAEYFADVPRGGGTDDVAVYDVAAKVQGVSIDSDILEIEAQNGQLSVDERFFVHNTSSPAMTQSSAKTFEIILPADAVLGDVAAQRPGGLPTNAKLVPDGGKGHYAFNVPIQPDQGDKDTLFQVSYTLPYSSGKYDFHEQVTMAADNFAVLMPKSMSLAGGSGASFQSIQADPGVQTLLMKHVEAGKTINFSISGTGAIPREEQNGQGDNGQGGAPQAGQPGGGIAPPINTPDPLSKYKWWILGGLALLMAAVAAFLLRKPAEGGIGVPAAAAVPLIPAAHTTPATPAGKNAALLNVLKEELFALESERIAGTLPAEEYAEQKAALEIVLKRALKKTVISGW
ncbi:MAG: carboxypeptidase regulatory-like domain-containing protein [Terracidiphilus sp.]|nr:carboxypeptidase regulatory-like domain-containing protein [Terracidiphilus sp.]MDR3798305.1 carboxypeptidase regulatory-like domain-containing protein [Terracidiphilus sp.]